MNSISQYQISQILLITATAMLSSTCTQHNPSDLKNGEEYITHEQEVSLVDTMHLKRGNFVIEIFSNGRLSAVKKAPLQFGIPGIVEKVFVTNGRRINKGEVIAALREFEYRQNFERARADLVSTRLEMDDMLLSYKGGRINDSVPTSIQEAFAAQSGYLRNLSIFKVAEFNLLSTRLSAPFAGTIASLDAKAHEFIDANEPIALLIDDSAFEVNFSLVESEISMLDTNDPVSVIPIAEKTVYKGFVEALNPTVNENGLIAVTAKIKNTGRLIDGMNVQVILEKNITDQLILPKSAVVLREDNKVIFKYVDGRASWVYVETVYENSQYYAVKATKDSQLREGDAIITKGNINLAHHSAVAIDRTKN